MARERTDVQPRALALGSITQAVHDVRQDVGQADLIIADFGKHVRLEGVEFIHRDEQHRDLGRPLIHCGEDFILPSQVGIHLGKELGQGEVIQAGCPFVVVAGVVHQDLSRLSHP